MFLVWTQSVLTSNSLVDIWLLDRPRIDPSLQVLSPKLWKGLLFILVVWSLLLGGLLSVFKVVNVWPWTKVKFNIINTRCINSHVRVTVLSLMMMTSIIVSEESLGVDTHTHTHTYTRARAHAHTDTSMLTLSKSQYDFENEKPRTKKPLQPQAQGWGINVNYN